MTQVSVTGNDRAKREGKRPVRQSAPTGGKHARPRGIGPKTCERFIEALAEGLTVGGAAAKAGHDRRRFYEIRERDEQFAAAWEEAIERGNEALEDSLFRRSLEGFFEDEYDGEGRLLRRRKRINPNDAIVLLKKRNHEFRESGPTVNVSQTQVQAVDHLAADYTPTSIADVVRLAAELGVVTIDGEAVEAPAEIEA